MIGRYRLGDADQLTVGVANVLNRQYLPVFSELFRNNPNTSRVPSAGAMLNLRTGIAGDRLSSARL